MKKKFMNIVAARQWNRLLSKFRALRRRIKQGTTDTRWLHSEQHQRLVVKLQGIYAKLERLQHSVGLKLAGTTLAMSLTAISTQAQTPTFAAGVLLQANAVNIDVGYMPSSVFADIDSDGDLDLYAGEKDGTINVFTNDGSGVFTPAPDLQADLNNINIGSVSSPTFADIDRDGDLDLYLGHNNGTIQVFTNDGSGVFAAASDMQIDGITIDVGTHASPCFADIDTDGDLDLYVGSNYGNIKVFTNNGSGVFNTAGNLQADAGDIDVGNHSNLSFADIDTDGDLDLYAGNHLGRINVFINNGSGSFTSAANLAVGGNIIDIGHLSSVTFADIDTDGDLDLYVGEYFGSITFFENTTPVAPLEYDAATTVQAGGLTFDVNNYSSPMFEDINRDGFLDLYAGSMDGKLVVAINNGDGSFAAVQPVLAGGNAIDVGDSSYPAFADLDNDGDMDLYIGNTQGYVKLFENDGTGVFAAPTDVLANSTPLDNGTYACIVFADIDTDGDLDLYAGDNLGTITWYENTDGQGTFAAGAPVTDGVNPIDVGNYSMPSFADLDHDGDFDLYVGTELGVIKVFANDGSGNFSATANFKLFGGNDLNIGFYASPTFADVDRDGDLDLYVGKNDGNVLFYEAFKKTTATAAGNWSDEATWSTGVPNGNYNAYIGGGEITINANSNANHITIENTGKLTVESGKSLTATNMIIKSDASGTGSFVNNGTLTLSRTSTVQLYLAGAGRYYYISSPVASMDATTIDALSSKLYQTDGSAWTQLTAGNLNVMQGYAWKTVSPGTTLNFTGGALNDGNQSIAQSSGTFTLVGNPYPSAIDWGTNGNVPASLNADLASIVYRVGGQGDGTGTGSFAQYNRLSGGINGGQRYIPAMQAFWVENAGTGDISVGNDARVHNGQAFYKNAQKPTSKGVYLTVNSGDEALIAFNPDATDAYNSTKMVADGLPQIYTVNGDKKLAINTFKGDGNLTGLIVPVGFVAAQSGTQSIAMKDFNDFDASVSVYLEDKLTGTMHNLRTGTYSFDATQGTINDRFVLHFTNNTTGVTNANTSDVNVYAYDKMVYVSLSGKQTTSSEVSVFDVAGRLVAAKNLSGFQNLTGLYIAQTGVYVVKVSTANGVTTHKIVIE